VKVIVTGASGLLGRQIYKYLSESTLGSVLGLAFTRSDSIYRKLDLCDHQEVEKMFDIEEPQAVIHAAAERRPDNSARDPEKAYELNVEATRFIANCCAQRKTTMLYISTDYVFDGTSPPYSPESIPSPLNSYGQSKLDGETCVLKYPQVGMVLRVPVLYGPIEFLGESPITELFALVSERKETLVDHWAIRYPTYTCDVAAVCGQILRARQADSDLGGIFHWSGNEAYTKYELACMIAKSMKLEHNHLKPSSCPTAGSPRPKNSQLDCSRLERMGFTERTPLGASLLECLLPFRGA